MQVVEKLELAGLDFLWQICLDTPDPMIAESAISLLMNVSYSNITPKLKKVRRYELVDLVKHLPQKTTKENNESSPD